MNEKDLAIQTIIAQGVVTPRKRLRRLIQIGRFCSPGILLFGTGDSLFLGLLAGVILWAFVWNIDKSLICCGIFCVSPIAYLTTYLLTSRKEQLLQLYDMKMTCRYTLRQVTAFQMLYFGFVNMLLNTVMIVILQSGDMEAMLWRYLGISFSSIFLYGICILLFCVKGSVFAQTLLVSVIWSGTAALLTVCWGDRMEQFFLQMEGMILTGIAAALFIGYLGLLYRYLTARVPAGK